MVSLIGRSGGRVGSEEKVVAERVHSLGDYAAGQGVILAVEPHSGTAFDTPDKALWLMDTLQHPPCA
jgi:sugar phosphate isomerase/epimerase